MRSPRPLALTVLVTAFALALPGLAHAATYCVNSPGCSGTSEPDLQSALTAAQGTAGVADRVQVGDPGTPPAAGYGYNAPASNPVDIVGAGTASTVLTATDPGSTVLALSGAGSTVSHLTLRLPAGGSYGAQTNASLTDVDVTSADPGTGSQTGAYLFGSPTWVGGHIRLPSGSGNMTGTYSSTPGVAVLLQDLSIDVNQTGVLAAQGSATLRRVSLSGKVGVTATDETLTVDNVAFHETVSSGSFVAAATSLADTSVDLNHVSAFGHGVDSSAAVALSGTGGHSATMTVRNSILSNFGFDLYRDANGPGAQANLTVSYTALDPVATQQSTNENGGTGSTVAGPGNIGGDPKWADPADGDFHLLPGSPAIDAGTPLGILPGESSTDVLGAPRLAGGRVDMGAVEFQPPPAPPPADHTAPSFRTSKLPKKLSLKRLLAGISFTIVPSEPSSIDATLAGSARSVKLAKSYNLTLAHRKLGLAAGRRRVTLKVRRKLLGSSRKFSLRLTIVATDAAGNKRTLRRTIKVRR